MRPAGAPPLSPECRLVFATAHVAPDAGLIASLLKGPLDWGRVLMLAERERATPVLWRAIERAGLEGVPTAAADHLRRSAMVYDFRMLRLATKLEATLASLHSVGAPVLLLKGAALASSVYDGFTSRPMTDIDLLVHTSDVPAAREAVIASGWPETSDPVLRELLQDQHHLPHFVDPEPTGLRVELHTMLLPPDEPFTLDAGELWASARPARAPFDAALVADAEFLMLHACLHFAWSHTMSFGAWRTIRDVTALTRDARFSWERLVERAGASKGLTSCYWTLRLAERLAGAAIPEEVLRELAPPTPELVRRAIERHFVTMIAPGEAPPCPSIKVARMLWMAALRPKWSGHAQAGRFDPEGRWQRALGTASTETFPQRIKRHGMGIRHWWNFVVRTLAPFS